MHQNESINIVRHLTGVRYRNVRFVLYGTVPHGAVLYCTVRYNVSTLNAWSFVQSSKVDFIHDISVPSYGGFECPCWIPPLWGCHVYKKGLLRIVVYRIVNAPVGTNLYVYCTEYVKIRPSVGTKPCPLRQSSMRLPQGTRKPVPTEATYVRKQRTGKFLNTGNKF